MATIINMPRLSDTMEEGVVAKWLKKVGDKVEEGDILAEIETDKATMEFESFYDGTLLHIGIQEGETSAVDTLLAIIGEEGENITDIINESSNPKEREVEENPAKKESSEKEEKPKVSPTVKDKAPSTRVFASPLAKKIAHEKRINLEEVTSSNKSGRIVKKDVENYTPDIKTFGTKKPFSVSNVEKSQEVSNSQMRKAIAKSLANSKFSAPHFYLNIEVNMDEAIASRKIINAIPDTKVSFNDMVVKASAMALEKHPKVNTSWTDNSIILHEHISIGVAVAVDDGLVVPVVNFVNQLSLSQIGSAVKDLATRARDKKIKIDEMQGSTFTVSNLGMFGIESFTSIINQPNSAILSVGAIMQRPIVKNGEIVIGNVMTLTLACDHRSVDGAIGAQFLQTLQAYIENPVTMLA